MLHYSRPLLAALCVLAPVAAAAQAPATPAPSLGGALVPGVCLLSQQGVIANAKVGLAATARLKQLAEQAQVEVDADRKPIEADAQALESQRATLKPADLQQRQQAVTARLQALQQKAAQRSREIEATRQKALARIATEAQPVIAQIYKTHSCGLLMDRSAILGGNMGGDLTAAVVQGLDGKIATLTFDREALPAAPATP